MTAIEQQPLFPDFGGDDFLVVSQRWSHGNRVAVLRCLCLLPNVEVEDGDATIHLHFFDSRAPGIDDPFAWRGCAIAFATLSHDHLELTSSHRSHAEQVARAIEQACGILLQPMSRNETTVPQPDPVPPLASLLMPEGLDSRATSPPPAEQAVAPVVSEPTPEHDTVEHRAEVDAPAPLTPDELAAAVAVFSAISDRLGRTLDTLLASTPAFEAAFLVSPAGRPIAGVVPHDCEGNVASITVKMLDLGTQAAGVLKRGPLKQVIVHGPLGYGLLAPVAPGLLLLVRITEGARLGAVFHDVERMVEAIASSL